MGVPDEELRQQLRRLNDRLEIEDLVTRYGMAVDDRDMEALSALFTHDGAFRHADGWVDVTGRDEILAFYERQLAFTGPSYHYAHGHLVNLEDVDVASGVVNAHAELGIDGRTIVVALRYNDRYRREGGCWRFEERLLQFLYMMPLEDLHSSLSDPDRCRWPPPARAAQLPESLETWQRFTSGRPQ